MAEKFVARPEWVYTKTTEEFDPQGDELVERAWEFAKEAHRGQERVGGGAYSDHLAGVASVVC